MKLLSASRWFKNSQGVLALLTETLTMAYERKISKFTPEICKGLISGDDNPSNYLQNPT
jgi:hypothetical protein